jgi:hypothetical protein
MGSRFPLAMIDEKAHGPRRRDGGCRGSVLSAAGSEGDTTKRRFNSNRQ